MIKMGLATVGLAAGALVAGPFWYLGVVARDAITEPRVSARDTLVAVMYTPLWWLAAAGTIAGMLVSREDGSHEK